MDRAISVAINELGYRIGESHQRSTISDAMVDGIRELYEDAHLRQTVIAARLGLKLHYVKKVCNYQIRSQVPHDWKCIHVN